MVDKEKRKLYNQRYYAKKKDALRITIPETIVERNLEVSILPPPSPFHFLFLLFMKAYDFIKCKLFFKY